MKIKGQRDNRGPIETLALVYLGVRDGPATRFWNALAGGSVPPTSNQIYNSSPQVTRIIHGDCHRV